MKAVGGAKGKLQEFPALPTVVAWHAWDTCIPSLRLIGYLWCTHRRCRVPARDMVLMGMRIVCISQISTYPPFFMVCKPSSINPQWLLIRMDFDSSSKLHSAVTRIRLLACVSLHRQRSLLLQCHTCAFALGHG